MKRRAGRRQALFEVAMATCALLLVSCDVGGSPGTVAAPPPSPTSSVVPSAGGGFGAVRVRLVKIASLDQPIAMAVRPGDPALYVAEKVGRVVAIRSGHLAAAAVLDISAQVSQGGEQGLLGIAFSPDGQFLYASYTDRNGNSNIVEFAMQGGRVNPTSRREVLFVHQPFSNHNGGVIAFGPDGYLYVGLGDGGSEGDPQGNGQSLGSLLGKMLRIDPRPSNGRPYGIPPDNPFVHTAGARPEIWADGLRNPWRFSFDKDTGDLWIGDVGQNTWEEIDRQAAASVRGANYGWNLTEGDHSYKGVPPAGWVRPVYEYSHAAGGCAVTGGYVYRGSDIPGLRAAYVFADYCLGRIMALRWQGGRVTAARWLGATVRGLDSFGEDLSGELYAMSLDGALYRLARA